MNCIEENNILSTTIVGEDFSYYNGIFKISSDSINKLKAIENKYADRYNKERLNLKNTNNSYYRNFIYRFKDYVLIKNIVYPLENTGINVIEVIDLSNNNEEKIMSINIKNQSKKLDILLDRKCNAIELRVKNKNNVFPLIEEIEIIESM